MTPAPHGRGSADNPPNRFIPLHYVPDPHCPPHDAPAPATRFFRHSVGIVTKSGLVTRDLDLLTELASHKAAVVFLSITTLDAELAGRLEPRAARPAARLAAVEELAKAGVPVGVMTAPMIPGLND